MARVHLDTDIGGDIDDLCALALLLRWPDAEVTGVTTVSDEGGRRAGYARYALRLAGREDIPVAAGADVDRGCYRDRPQYPNEGRYWPEPVAPLPGRLDAALDLLEASIAQGAIVVGIGPFTNLALLEQRTPGILARARLVLMGGCVRPIRPGFPQWSARDDYNVQMDVAATRAVLAASDPLLVTLTVSVETALRRACFPALQRGGPLASLIVRQGEAHDADYQTAARYGATCPALPEDIVNFQHDPLAVAVALGWDGVTIERLPLAVRIEDGWLRTIEQPGGKPTAVVTAVDGERFNEFWLQRVASA